MVVLWGILAVLCATALANICPGNQATCQVGQMTVYDRVDATGFAVIIEPSMNHAGAVRSCQMLGLGLAELSSCTAFTASDVIVAAFGGPKDVWISCSCLAYYSGETGGCGAIAVKEEPQIYRPVLCQKLPPPPCLKSGKVPTQADIAKWKSMFKFAQTD